MNTELKNRLAGLDHLRALAITLVFLYHYKLFQHPDWINSFSFGWTGVDLFFILSGYLISSQLFKEIQEKRKIDFRKFYLKRFFRIIPAYLTVLSIYFFIPAFREKESLSSLWKFLTFTQNFGLDLRTFGTFSHAWSLCIEEQFYFLFPLVLSGLMYYKTGWKGLLLLGLFVSGFIIRLFNWNHLTLLPDQDNFVLNWYKLIYYPTFNRLDGLLVGIGIAGSVRFLPQVKTVINKYGNLFLLAGLIMIYLSFIVCLSQFSFSATIFGFPLVAISYGLIVISSISPSSFLYKYSSKITSTLATLSYSIYLTHKGLIHLTQVNFGRFGIVEDGTLMFFISLVVCLAGGWLLNLIVEKPFFRLRDRILSNKREVQYEVSEVY